MYPLLSKHQRERSISHVASYRTAHVKPRDRKKVMEKVEKATDQEKMHFQVHDCQRIVLKANRTIRTESGLLYYNYL